MGYEIEIRPLASLEIFEAVDWYNSQKQGLGFELLSCIEDFLFKTQQHPHVHSYFEKPIRQGKLERFPFVVVYEFINEKIVVYSVFMTSQSPQKKRTS